jgi:hypothetical protein
MTHTLLLLHYRTAAAAGPAATHCPTLSHHRSRAGFNFNDGLGGGDEV